MHSGYALYVTGGDARWWRGGGPVRGLGLPLSRPDRVVKGAERSRSDSKGLE